MIRESKYSFLYRAHDGSIMKPESFLNFNTNPGLVQACCLTLEASILNLCYSKHTQLRAGQSPAFVNI